jgi:hypothetical protein
MILTDYGKRKQIAFTVFTDYSQMILTDTRKRKQIALEKENKRKQIAFTP